MSSVLHKNLASGRWQELSLVEQLGNIGTEVSRVQRWFNKDKKSYDNAVLRTLELFDLTLSDSRWKGHLKEIVRTREVFCDIVSGSNEYKSSFEDLEEYFYHYAFAARNK